MLPFGLGDRTVAESFFCTNFMMVISEKIRLWVTQGQRVSGRTLYSDGASLYSYRMEIARREVDSRRAIQTIMITGHSPSRTTAGHVNMVRNSADAAGFLVVECINEGMPYASTLGAPLNDSWSKLLYEMRVWRRRYPAPAVVLTNTKCGSGVIRAAARGKVIMSLVSLRPSAKQCVISVCSVVTRKYTTRIGAVFESEPKSVSIRCICDLDHVSFVGTVPAPIRRYYAGSK